MRLKLGCCITLLEVIPIKIGFIGPGKVGVNLGRYFTHKGIEVSGFYGKNIESTKEASIITNSRLYNNYEEIIKDSEILFITTPDDIISIIDIEISKYDLKNKSVCHASGSLKSTVLSNAKLSGALIYSIHPMFAFSNKNISIEELDKIYFSIEGDLNTKSINNIPVINFMKTLGNKYFQRNINYSSTYHLANVFVSNLVLSLLDIGTSYLKKIGLTEKEALDALFPLIQGNLENIHENGFINSLTGPVVRGDLNTIKKHLEVLESEDRDIYNSLSLNLLKLTVKQNMKLFESNENKNINRSYLDDSEKVLEEIINLSQKHYEIFKLLGGLE